MSTVAHQPAPITREGHQRLRAELERLVNVGRREMAQWLREAREDRDPPGENAGLAAILQERAALERRIDELERMLAWARIAEPPINGIAGIGQRVLVRGNSGQAPTEYVLVGAMEADLAQRRLSVDSPVGRALMGRRAGDTIEVEAPGGARTIEILAVGDHHA